MQTPRKLHTWLPKQIRKARVPPREVKTRPVFNSSFESNRISSCHLGVGQYSPPERNKRAKISAEDSENESDSSQDSQKGTTSAETRASASDIESFL